MRQTTAEVWDNFNQELYNFISSRVASPEDADDLLQETFLKIHSNMDTLREEDRLISWLYRIARNTIIDHYRTRQQSVEITDDLVSGPDSFEEEPEALLAASLGEMIHTLPDLYQQPLILSEIEGVKQAEIAEQLGLSVSGVKSRIQRGRERLRQALLDCCHFEFDRRGRIIEYTSRPNCCQRCST